MFSNIASGFPSALNWSFAISISFSIIEASTSFSFKAIGFIAAACIATSLATTSAPSEADDKPTIVAILLPACM